MLNTGRFSQPCNSQSCLTATATATASFSTSFASKPHISLIPKVSSTSSFRTLRAKAGSFLTSLQQFQPTHLKFRAVLGERRNGLCVFAQKKGGKGNTRSVVEVEEDFDDDDEEEEEDFDDDDFEDYDDDDDGVDLSLKEMKEWRERKPTGFGQGKVYDTSLEDKLLQELEQSRKAQTANLQKLKLKDNPGTPNSKKQKEKESGVVPNGIRVRVVNLPKKKNVHRDLQSAFKGVPGLINITPAVSGNKKTRDPICKGFAFVDFKSEEDASRFIEIFSKESIAFGKVQKRVKYEMINSRSSSLTLEKSSDATKFAPQLRLPRLEGEQDAEVQMDGSSWEEISDESTDLDDELVASHLQDFEDDELVTAQKEDIEDDALVTAQMEEMEDDELMTAEMEDIEDDELLISQTEDIEDDELLISQMEDIEDDEFVTAQIEDIEDELITGEMEDIKENMQYVSISKLNSGDSIEPRTNSPASLSSSKTKERLIAKGKGEKIPNVGDIGKNLAHVSVSELNGGDSIKLRTKSAASSSSSEQIERIEALEKRLHAKLKGEKIPKLDVPGTERGLKIKEKVGQTDASNSRQREKSKALEKKRNAKEKGKKIPKLVIPGSAKRLRVREKSVLTDVFSKYGKAALVSKEDS